LEPILQVSILDLTTSFEFPPMSASDEYRARAIECIQAADATDSPERKTIFLELAQRWLDLSSRMDTRGLRGNVLLPQPRPMTH
jgi:hypothetical protein